MTVRATKRGAERTSRRKLVSWNALPIAPNASASAAGTPSSGAMMRPTEPAEPSM